MRALAFAILWLLTAMVPAAAAPAVVASIAPLHSLVAAVMKGVGEPELLLPANASPHAYAMKPSQARAVGRAEVVFWVGPSLETFLQKALGTLGGNAHIVAMQDLPGIRFLPLREGGAWENHEQPEHEEGEPGHDGVDPHVWLDVSNAKVFAAAAAQALTRADPANARTYEANRDSVLHALDRLDAELRETLQPVAHESFLVFHDAYHYVEARYGLTAAGSVTVAADRQPGARRVAELRKSIQDLGIRCVFREPQFNPRLIQPIVGGLPVTIGVLDPLGGDLAGGPDQYFLMMRALGRGLRDCLAASH